MKKLFLTSSIHTVARDVAKKLDLKSANKLVFIMTAAEPRIHEDITWLQNDRKSLVDAGFDVQDYTITGKTLEDLERDLITFDYIYVSGGSTNYLLEQSHKSGFFEYVKELILVHGKTYIGTSAGSIVAGPRMPEHFLKDGIKEVKGYEFVNFTVLPHWGREDFKKVYLDSSRLGLLYNEQQVPLVLLTDNQYIVVENDKCEIVNVRNLVD
jgi:peptidase E